MLLYSLLNTIFAFLVTGQAFLVQGDLEQSHTVDYLLNFISDVGFKTALWYVLGISILLLVLALVSGGYRKKPRAKPEFSFIPSRSFYVILFILLCVFSVVLIFFVVGLSDFLHSSRPGFQQGSTIFLVLLYLGLLPLLFKIIYYGKIGFGDVACFLVSFAVTGAMGRISAGFYMFLILLALYHSRGWADKPLTARLLGRFLLFGIAAVTFFVAYGAIRGAQAFTSGSLTDLLGYVMEHPEKSVLSLDWNYRFDIEGMSGIAGAFTQYLTKPYSARHDYGAAWILTGATQWWPGFLKPYASGLDVFGAGLGWYPFSIVPTGVETFFTSFGWPAVILFPVSVYIMSWTLPLRFERARLSPLGTLIAYVLMAWTILFVRGPLTVWIAFSFSYTTVTVIFWPLFARQFKRTGVAIAYQE
jgi:hypothetical protein